MILDLVCGGCAVGGRLVVETIDAPKLPCPLCGVNDWIVLPWTDEELTQVAIDRGDLIETPYGYMTREQFHAHARVLHDYYERLHDEMRRLDE